MSDTLFPHRVYAFRLDQKLSFFLNRVELQPQALPKPSARLS